MKITQNWFYKLENISENKIEIWENLTVILFDNLWISFDLSIWKNSKVEFYWFLNWKIDFKNYNTNFLQNSENSNIKLRYLLLSKDFLNLKAKIKSEINSSFTKSDFKVISIANENWNIDIDWIIN